MRHYRPRLDEALEPDPRSYATFNEFFTRPLAPGARPIASDPRAVLSPCDGAVSMLGAIDDRSLLQAKGRRYTLDALLTNVEWASRMRGGHYATLYLAPSDYHRVHMPLAGRLLAAWHVPGRLFSVNQTTAQRVPGLFARNERLVCAFEGDEGAFVVILVGALFVGSMSTVWHGEVTPWRDGLLQPIQGVHRLPYGAAAAGSRPRGAEIGRFNMGSTVILLLPPGRCRWNAELTAGTRVRMGHPIGQRL